MRPISLNFLKLPTEEKNEKVASKRSKHAKDFADPPGKGSSRTRSRCEPILTRSAFIEKQPRYRIEEEHSGGARRREGGGADGRPPSLQGALTVRKYRAYHVASAPWRVTPMTQVVPEGSQPR